MMNNTNIKNTKEFLNSDEFMMLMMILFPPLGILILWRKNKFSKIIMVLISILLGGSYIIVGRAVLQNFNLL